MSSRAKVKAGDVVIRRGNGPRATVFVQVVADPPQEPWEAMDYVTAIQFAHWMVTRTRGRLWVTADDGTPKLSRRPLRTDWRGCRASVAISF